MGVRSGSGGTGFTGGGDTTGATGVCGATWLGATQSRKSATGAVPHPDANRTNNTDPRLMLGPFY